MIESVDKYVKNTERLRILSTPSLAEIDSPGEYEIVLRENFRRIGELAEENRRILADVLLPILESGRRPGNDQIHALITLCEKLIYGEDMENLDIPLGNMISSALWKFLRYSDDIELVLTVADLHATTCYLMLNYSKRTYPFSDLCEQYREEGMELCDFARDYLEYDEWMKLPSDEIRKLVINLVRYKAVFYENALDHSIKNEEEMQILDEASALIGDDRYMSIFSKDERIRYQVRVAEYYGVMLEAGNRRGFGYMQCLKIAKHTQELQELWKKEPEICQKYAARSTNEFFNYRSLYYAGDLSAEEYKNKMLEIYQRRNETQFELDDVYLNLLLPMDYMMLIGRHQISEVESSQLEHFYHNAINYVFQLPNSGVLVYTLEYLEYLLSQFREIPGGVSFEEIGLNCMAALHPPTYVHSKMVAVITRCLCKHLIKYYPQYFLNFINESDISKVREHREEIMDFAYHAALCHDFGKLAIIDTVFVYGRNIMDSEFTQIKSHPEIGAKFLSRNASTSKYVNIARGHHRWYNDSKGYPVEFDTSRLPEKVIIDLVCCADCMDAATDTAGRSYNKGKTLDEYIGEVKEGAGTRYAPYLPELLEKEDVRRDLNYLLTDMRNMTYRDTFVMLRRLQLMGTEN